MADPTSNLSFRLTSTASAFSDSSKMEALPPTQVALATLQLNASSPEIADHNDSLIPMFIKGMKIIQDQVVIIEKQSKKLQEQEIEIEKLRAELENMKKKHEQSPKKEKKTATSTGYTSPTEHFRPDHFS